MRLVLEFYNSPDLLGACSPLAKPYFLANTLPTQKETGQTVHWGAVLISAIDQAAGRLWGGPWPERHFPLVRDVEAEEATSGRGGKYDFFLLELSYFKKLYRPHPRTQADIYNDILYISRATYNRHLKDAVERLAEQLLEILRPSLRLEIPYLPIPVVGRSDLRNRVLELLYRKKTVSLIGPSGIGKTTLGAFIRAVWSSRQVFWYTIQPGFNSTANALFFGLGYFLHQQGANGLWQQLVADGGKVEDLSLALGLVLADIEALDEPPLLCFDEIGHLYAADPDQESQDHAQIKTLLHRLRRTAPLLLIGQRTVIESDAVFELNRIDQGEIEAWLKEVFVSYTGADLVRLETYTEGNPRLIGLCIALHRLQSTTRGISFAETLATLPHTPGYGPVWDRVQGYLSPVERRLIQGIAVFRLPAPTDAWDLATLGPQEGQKGADETEPGDGEPLPVAETIDRLIERQLIYTNGTGGLYLLPMLRDIIYRELSIEQRELLHSDAAGMYLLRGEYTEAAYHLQKADRPEDALRVWFPVWEKEIARGRSDNALAIFNQVSANRLNKRQQKELAIIRGQLHARIGNAKAALADFENLSWEKGDPISSKGMLYWGQALNISGDSEKAIEKITLAISLDESAHLNQINLLSLRGSINQRQRNFQDAEKDASLAYYQVEILRGRIQDQKGSYQNALAHFESARNTAQKINYAFGIAESQYIIGITLARLEKFEDAQKCFFESIEQFVQIGNKVQEMYVRSNLGSMLTLAKRFENGLQQSKIALDFYERAQNAYWIALNSTTIAEIYFELGDLQQAESYALKTIQQEEIHFFPYGYYTLGSVKRVQGELSSAKDYFEKSVEIARGNEDRYLLAFAQRGLGETYRDLGQLDACAVALKRAQDLFKQLQISSEIEKTTRLIKQLK